MANPRQRRKARSSAHRPVSHSRHAKRNLKKTPPIRGPSILQAAWDNRKTVRQNYASLGLVHDLNPTASGGAEQPTIQQDTVMEVLHDVPVPLLPVSNAASGSGSTSASIPKGHAKIVRDGDGNVIRVEFAEGEDPEDQGEEDTETIAELPQPEVAPIAWNNWVEDLGGAIKHPISGKDGQVVHALEQLSTLTWTDSSNTLSASITGVGGRHSSNGETRYLQRLVDKYGANLAGMSKDQKLNPDQRTEGQLRRALQRGGFSV